MTEMEWLASDDPKPMLESPPAPVSERKLRLFGCACCRRVAHLLSDPGFAQAIEVSERHADGLATADECRSAHRGPYDYYTSARAENRQQNNVDLAVAWATMARGRYPTSYAVYVVENACRLGGEWVHGQALDEKQQQERAQQAKLMREVFGNPFRPIAFSPSWRTDTALSLARQMYESRDFGAMPILADALQDAGCDSDDTLVHCRNADATHARGCWVVDLVLDRV